MMKKLVLIVCIIVGSLWFLLKKNFEENTSRTKPSVEQDIPPPKQTSNTTRRHLKFIPGEASDLKVAHPVTANMQVKTTTTIEYEIEDGLAVAFGDVVLGSPKSEQTESHGFIKPSHLQLWGSTEIPYYIQPSLPQPERVLQALGAFSQTPMRFIPYSGQKDALVFQPRLGNCKSYLGKVGGLQPIWLADTCQPAEILHEIMHALGFIHEHSRTDRDGYVDVMWDNIDELYKSQFAVVPDSLMETSRGIPFDYQSIMIYPADTFAKQTGLKTLLSKSDVPILPSNSLSALDIKRLYKFYGH